MGCLIIAIPDTWYRDGAFLPLSACVKIAYGKTLPYLKKLNPFSTWGILEDPGAVSWVRRKGGTKGGSFARTWKRSSRLFSRPDWLPLGLRRCTWGRFLTFFCLVPGCDHRRTVFSHSLIIKEGFVKKCRYLDSRLPKPFKFKKRYCWLSTENFLYAKTNDSQVTKQKHSFSCRHQKKKFLSPGRFLEIGRILQKRPGNEVAKDGQKNEIGYATEIVTFLGLQNRNLLKRTELSYITTK